MEEFYKTLRKRLYPKGPSTKKNRSKPEERKLTPFQKWKLNGGMIHPGTIPLPEHSFSDYENCRKIRQPFTELQNILLTSSMYKQENKVKMLSLNSRDATYYDVYGSENNNNNAPTQIMVPPVQVDHFQNYPNPNSAPSYFSFQSPKIQETRRLHKRIKERARPTVANQPVVNSATGIVCQDVHQVRMHAFTNESQHKLPVPMKNPGHHLRNLSYCSSTEILPAPCYFSDLVFESNGKWYAESSNVKGSFLQLLEQDDAVVMESETVEIDLCETSSTHSLTPIMDSELAYILSESSLVVEHGNSSFFDVLQDVHDTQEEEEYLANIFLDVFEGVENLNVVAKQGRKTRDILRRRMERECETVFNGQEPWLSLRDLKNEVAELNAKSDLVSSIADGDITKDIFDEF